MNVEDSDDDFEAAVASIVEANLSVVRCLTAEDEEEMEDTEVREAKERNKDRGRAEGHRRLMADYFDTPSVYSAKDFRRRFRMSRRLFLHVMDRVCVADPWFVQKPDCTGLLGLSSHQKVTSAMRQLAYGISADAVHNERYGFSSVILINLVCFQTDEYVRIGESTVREALKR